MTFSILAVLLAADEPQQRAPGLLDYMPLLVGFLLLFYFLVMRPAKRQESERQALIGSIRKNDEVVTTGGIIGLVITVKKEKDEVVLKIDDNVRLRVLLSSIIRVRRQDDKDEAKTENESS